MNTVKTNGDNKEATVWFQGTYRPVGYVNAYKQGYRNPYGHSPDGLYDYAFEEGQFGRRQDDSMEGSF